MRALVMENTPGTGAHIAPWVENVGRLEREACLPVFHAARVSDLAPARRVVAAGHLDMAGLTHAQIADPHLVAKLAEGQEDRIRPRGGAQPDAQASRNVHAATYDAFRLCRIA